MHFIRHKALCTTYQPSYMKPIYKMSLDSQHNMTGTRAYMRSYTKTPSNFKNYRFISKLVAKYTMIWSHRSFHLNHDTDSFLGKYTQAFF